MRIALTRDLTEAISRCELSHLARAPIDVPLAVAQHAEYEQCLMELGCRVHRLPADATMPDAVFIEDTAVVVEELAVVTRPGAESRRPEVEAVAPALAAWRSLASIEAPGTLDGGDVLPIGRTIYVGHSARTNRDGIAQLAQLLAPWMYRVVPVQTRDCLHLKTAVTSPAPGLVVVNPAWVSASIFEGCTAIEVDPAEPFAANVLRVGDVAVCAAEFPRTNARLADAGVTVRTVAMSETAKAEGGVTCCSVIVDTTEEQHA